MIGSSIKPTKALIKELHDKKGRTEHQMFLVEGAVSVLDFLYSEESEGYQLHALFGTKEFIRNNHLGERASVYEATPDEIEKMGTLKSNDQALAVFAMNPQTPFVFDNSDKIILALSDVNDPGNLGTIIRICDWYGIKKIVASKNTVDVYNPKVISATKGSFSRVQVFYEDLGELFTKYNTIPVFGADLQGENVHGYSFPDQAFLLMGSESHGIHPDLISRVTQKITIPKYGGAESLNVGVATAIILDNWMR
jgi:TrmH family RNA methyltransferase